MPIHVLPLPAAGITCPHGALAPEAQSAAARRALVSEASWQLLREVWALSVVQELNTRHAKGGARAAATAAAAVTDNDASVDVDGARTRGGHWCMRVDALMQLHSTCAPKTSDNWEAESSKGGHMLRKPGTPVQGLCAAVWCRQVVRRAPNEVPCLCYAPHQHLFFYRK